MAIATIPVLLGVGDHASRPAASAVGIGGVYSCTDHNLIYQTDGSSWTTWATLGSGGGVDVEDDGTPLSTTATTLDFVGAGVTATGSGATKTITIPGGSGSSEDNEAAASVLTDATSTGDAGSRADHFPGTSLGGAWTVEGTALTTSAVKYSAYGFVGAAGNPTQIVQAYTPSGVLRVEARIKGFGAGTQGIGFGVRDSGTNPASGDGSYLWIDYSSSVLQAFTLSGFTQRGSNVALGAAVYDNFYLRVDRDGSNNWAFYYSFDRALWTSIATGVSLTFTVAKLWLRCYGAVTASVDFVDVVS